MNENDILELIWNYLPDDNDYGIRMDYYPPREKMPVAEMYFDKDGKCYQIIVQEHPHN